MFSPLRCCTVHKADEAELAGSIDLNEDDESIGSGDDEDDTDEDVDGALDGIGELRLESAAEAQSRRPQRTSTASVRSRSVSSRSEHQMNTAALLHEAMDEFLQEQKDNLFVEGVNIPKGVRCMPKLSLHDVEDEADAQPMPVKEANLEQLRLQEESLLKVMELERHAQELRITKEIETCQEYLREERVEVNCT